MYLEKLLQDADGGMRGLRTRCRRPRSLHPSVQVAPKPAENIGCWDFFEATAREVRLTCSPSRVAQAEGESAKDPPPPAVHVGDFATAATAPCANDTNERWSGVSLVVFRNI